MNSLVALHRQSYPNDPRSDDAITLAYAQEHPDDFSKVPDAVQDYARITGQAAAQAAGVEPENAVTSGFRAAGEELFPAAATAGGALLAGGLAVETGPGAIPAAIAGGTAAGAEARYIQDKAELALLGEEGVARLRAQERANREAHPIATKIGEFLGQAPAMLGGRGLAKAAGVAEESLGGKLLENSASGAIMSGAGAAEAKVEGQDVSIPGEMIKGAVTMGPLGFLPAAKSVFGAIGWKAPTDAAVLGLGNALFDHFVKGTPIDPQALAQNIGTDIPGFMLMNGLTAVLHLPFFPTKDGLTSKEAGTGGQGTQQTQTEQADNTINPADAYHLTDDHRQILSSLAVKVADGDSSPEVKTAVLKNTSQMQDGTPNNIRAEAQVFFESELNRLQGERVAQAQGDDGATAGQSRLPSQPATPQDASVAPTRPIPAPPAEDPMQAARQPVAATMDAPEGALTAGNPEAGTTPPPSTSVVPEPVQKAREAIAIKTDEAPKKTGWQKRQGDPDDLINRIGFESAQVKDQGEAEAGRKQAQAFTDFEHDGTSAGARKDEVYKDSKAEGGDNAKTRKLVVARAKDGTHVIVASAYINGGKEYVTGLKGKGIQYETFLKDYEPIATVKTNEATKGYAVTYSPTEWNGIRETLFRMRQKARGNYTDMQDYLQRAGTHGREVEKDAAEAGRSQTNNVLAESAEDEIQNKAAGTAVETQETEIKGLNQAHASALFDAVKDLPKDRAQWEKGFVSALAKSDRINAVRKALQIALGQLQKSGLDPDESFRVLKNRIYESHTSRDNQSKEGFTESFLKGTGSRADGGAESERADTGRAEAGTATASGGEGAGEGAKDLEEAKFSVRKRKGKKVVTDADEQASIMRDLENEMLASRDSAATKAVEGPGWITPDGQFFEAEETPAVRMIGLQMGGHEAAALKWLEKNRPDLFEKLEQERVKHGYEDWTDADGQGLIREFMFKHGFVRMAGDHSQMFMEGRPTASQLKLATDSAMMRGHELIHDLGGGRQRTIYMPGVEELEMMSVRNGAYLAGDSRLASWFSDVVDSARSAGVDVRVLEGLVRGGKWTKRAIRLVVGSVGAPSKDDLALAFHEFGHEVFDKLGLPPAVQDAFHQAIARLSAPEDFTPVIAKGMDEGRVLPEEVLVERTGRALVAEGFNPAEAQRIADRLMRYAKRAYLRVAMAFQVGFLGEEHVNPELAEKYFQERVKAFLAGDSPMSFLSFLGGPKLTTAQLGDTFPARGGAGALTGVFNYETGQMDYRERSPETMEAMKFNSSQAAADYQRYQELVGGMRGKTLDQAMTAAKELEAIKNRNGGMPPKPPEEAKFSVRDNAGPAFNTVSDPNIISRDLNSPDKVSEDIAAFNALHDMHEMAFKAFEKSNPGKLTFEQFVKAFTNADGPALDKAKARNAELVANGFPAADPTPRPADLLSDASQKQSATKALEMGWSLREWLSQKARQADWFLKTADAKMERINARLGDLMKRYTDMDLQLANAKDELKDMHSDFSDDLKAVEGSARKAGVLAQVIAHLDQRLDNPLAAAKPYETTINRLYAKLTGDRSGTFIDLLQKVSQMSIDWRTVKVSEAADLISKMVAPGDPSLKQLESRAMAAITVAFAKSNYHVMEFLRLSRDSALEDRTKLNEILKGALENTREAIPRARELARKLPKLAVTADRLLDKLEEVKEQSYAHVFATHRAKTFLAFHRDAGPALRLQMAMLEKMIGARLQSWEPNDGAEYYVAPRPDATDEQVLASTHELKLNGIEGNEQIVKHIQQNNAWLNAVASDKRGALWNTIKEMTTKLEQTAGLAGHELSIKSSFINYALGSIVDKLESFGLGSGRAAAARVRRYSAERYAASPDADSRGGKWDATEANAMRAMGLKAAGVDKFRRLFLHAALSFAEKNPDIRAAFKGNKEAFEALLPRLKRYLEADRSTATALEQPGAWKALENYYRESYTNMEWVNGVNKKLGNKILQQGADGFKVERDPIGATFFTSLRRISQNAIRMYHSMRGAGWLGTEASGKFKADEVARQYDAADPALMDKVKARFTPDVWSQFVEPLVNREGRSAFYGVGQADGLQRIALRESVAKAAEASGNDPVKFAEHLYELEAGTSPAETRGEFVGRTLQTFQEFFDSVHRTQADNDDSVRHGIPTPPRLLQDARISEEYPGEWLEYQTYGRMEMHQMASQLSAQAAFGRNMEGMRQDLQTTVTELGLKASTYAGIVGKVTDANPGKSGRVLRDLIRKECGKDYTTLSQAARNLSEAKREQNQFESMMKLQGGLMLELKPFQEAISAIAGATVQGPGTALVHLGNFLQTFSKFGLGKTGAAVMKRTVSSMMSEQLGSLAQLFHTQIGWNADRNVRRNEAGLSDPDAKRRFRENMLSVTHDPVAATNPILRGLVRASRLTRAVVTSGAGNAQGETAYVTLKPHALFTQLAQHMNAAFIDGWTNAFEDMIERAAEHFRNNAPDALDPAFKFDDMKALGYRKGFLGGDARAFGYLQTQLARYGINLEQAARDLNDRRETDSQAPALTNDQFRNLASLVQNEVSLESNPVTRPSAFFTNPAIKLASPLLGWSVSKTHDLWESFRAPSMEQSSQNALKAFGIGMLPYLAIVPGAIALGMLRDKYNSAVLNKKANREDPTSFAGMLDSLSWVGVLGIGGEVVNSIANRDTQRPFDMDHRVLFMSSLLSAKQGVENWFQQGSADYATVYRPLMQALGGSGYLQYAQILNHALSLDNAEARVTARINAGNILRVAGREIGLDVRASGGGDSIATPMRPLMGQMVLAVYGNDAAGFRQAYVAALAQAREQGEQDPQKYVAQKFANYNPLRSVFRTEPSQLEVARMFGALDDDDRQAVRGALQLFNAYGEQIGAKPSTGRTPKAPASGGSLTLELARRRAAGG